MIYSHRTNLKHGKSGGETVFLPTQLKRVQAALDSIIPSGTGGYGKPRGTRGKVNEYRFLFVHESLKLIVLTMYHGSVGNPG